MRPIPHPFEIPDKPRLSRMLNDLRENVAANIVRSFQNGQVDRTANGTILRVKTPGTGTFNFPWQDPKELDPKRMVPAGTFVYISAGNALVTTGLTDLGTGTLITACPGIWQAVQDVPAQVVVGGITKYNVPQQLVNMFSTDVSGTYSENPQTDIADAANLFWIDWISFNPMQTCDAIPGDAATGTLAYRLVACGPPYFVTPA